MDEYSKRLNALLNPDGIPDGGLHIDPNNEHVVLSDKSGIMLEVKMIPSHIPDYVPNNILEDNPHTNDTARVTVTCNDIPLQGVTLIVTGDKKPKHCRTDENGNFLIYNINPDRPLTLKFDTAKQYSWIRINPRYESNGHKEPDLTGNGSANDKNPLR